MTKQEAWLGFAGTNNYGTIQREAFEAGWDAARGTAEYWKYEHLAGNAEIDMLRTQVRDLLQQRDDAITISQITAVTHERMVDVEAQVVKLTNDLDAALKTDQEPVAWMHETEGLSYENCYAGNVPLYLHPVSVVSSDPVAWYWIEKLTFGHKKHFTAYEEETDGRWMPLYTTPQARTLSDEDDVKLKHALENCRLLAARHRKEDWALLILGFCAEGGVVGSATR